MNRMAIAAEIAEPTDLHVVTGPLPETDREIDMDHEQHEGPSLPLQKPVPLRVPAGIQREEYDPIEMNFPHLRGDHHRLVLQRLYREAPFTGDNEIADTATDTGKAIHALSRLDWANVGKPIVAAVRERVGRTRNYEPARREILDRMVPDWRQIVGA